MNAVTETSLSHDALCAFLYAEARALDDRRFALYGVTHALHTATVALFCARQLGWSPARDFAQGLRDTVGWYLDHPQWIAAVGSAPNRSAAAVQQEQA